VLRAVGARRAVTVVAVPANTDAASERLHHRIEGFEQRRSVAVGRWEPKMPTYMFKVNYVGEGVKGLLIEGGMQRREAAEEVIKSLGGRLLSMYYAFGDADAYVIAEMPDAASAAALVLTLNATGRVEVTTTVLMTPQEIDEAVAKRADYRPPGS
jgi:uncharacterized protein with GYD domain